MRPTNLLVALSPLVAVVKPHVFMGNPPPFRWHEVRDIVELVMPLNGGPGFGQQPFPCKGHHVDIDGPGGQAGATWDAGQRVTFQLFDSTNTTGPTMNQVEGAAHSGGSCQISFSYDKGETWAVIQSWEGDCPRVRTDLQGQVTNHYDLNQDYEFTIPDTFPSGDRVIVAWTWMNASGNREYYMSCSPIKIRGVGSPTTITPEGHPLLIANLQANTQVTPAEDSFSAICHTLEVTSIIFPDRYRGINEPVRAPWALNLEPFPGEDNPACGSDCSNTLKTLGLPNPGNGAYQ